MRTRRVAASTPSSSASAPISPTSAKMMSPASSSSSHSASTTTASCCTGPPKDTVAPASTRPASSGTASATSISETRFSTRPTAPSSSCATTSRTVRRKFGSSSAGAAMRSLPRNDSPITSRPRRGFAAPPPTLQRSGEPTTIAVGFPRAKSAGLRATSSASVDGDRHVVEERLLDERLLGLDPLQHEARAGRCGEQHGLDLCDRLQLDELLLERARETAAPEVPGVELLQEAGRAPLAELAHRLADEQNELRDDLLRRRLGAVAFENLLQRPRVSLRSAPDHHRRGSRRGEDRVRLRARGDVAGRDHRHVDARDELGRQGVVRVAGVHLLRRARVQRQRLRARLDEARPDLEASPRAVLEPAAHLH